MPFIIQSPSSAFCKQQQQRVLLLAVQHHIDRVFACHILNLSATEFVCSSKG